MTEDYRGESDAERRALSATMPLEVPDEEIAAVRDVSFAIVMRGYDRAAVDAYVTRVNRIIAELQVNRSPQSAIRHALDQVSEETRGILERAHETADDITARSRSQAEDRLERAETEARDIVRDAETRVRELEIDADAMERERGRLIEDVRIVAEELERLAGDAAARFEPEPEPEPEPEAEDDTVAMDPPEPADDEETQDVELTEEHENGDGPAAEQAPPPLPPPVPPGN
jgi:DivIVA domain-containing protein